MSASQYTHTHTVAYHTCLFKCAAIAVNDDLSFATLKAKLYPKIEASAMPCTSLTHWERWWSNKTRARLPGGPYTKACGGCSLVDGILTCKSCNSGDFDSVAASVKVSTTLLLFVRHLNNSFDRNVS